MEKGTTRRAQLHVDAPPETVYDLVSDVTRMGEWSPECVACEWLDGATAPAVGARFRGKNKNRWARWSTKPRVVTADRGNEFAFVVSFLGREMTKWTYHFDRVADGTNIVESFEILTTLPFYIRLSDRLLMGVNDRAADLEANMQRTLATLKARVEADAATKPG
jgi:hypothetical protein